MKISGSFEVALNPLETYAAGNNGVNLGRMSIDKTFSGELSAQSKGEMLTASSPVSGSAGYVAVEQVTGNLSGRNGSFVLQHYGRVDKDKNYLLLEVVPGSGTGELNGINGRMNIRIENKHHFYDFDYEISE